MCTFAVVVVCLFADVHVFSILVCENICVSGSVSLYCSMRGHVFVRLNDHGLSEVRLPPRGLCCSLEKLSDALPLSFIPSVCLSLRLGEHKQRCCAFVRHKSPLPLKLPAPLFSCPNSTAIKLSWQEFRKQLRGEKDGGGEGGTLPPPPTVSSPLDITDLCSC